MADGAQIVMQGSSSAVSGQITEDVRKFNLRNPGKEILYLNTGGEAMELTGESATSTTSASPPTRRSASRRWSPR